MSGSAPGAAPSMVPPVNRVAAARKKLEEYKTKRKVTVKQDPNIVESTTKNTSESNKIVDHDTALNSVEKNDRSYDSNFENPDQSMHSRINQYQFNLNNSAPMNFFDELSNNVQYQQNEIKSESDNKYLLADVLFSNQNNNGNLLNDKIQHHVNSENSFHQESVFTDNRPPESNSNMFLENEKGSTVNNDACSNDNEDDSIDEAMSASAVIKLQQQLQFHMQTVEFLVSEKNTLSSNVNKLENIVAEMKNQNNDISDRLSISRQRASCLEVEYSTMKEKFEDLTKILNQARLENSKLKAAESSYSKMSNDLKDELTETKSLVNIKLSENADLVKKVEELMFHINANELRYQQLNQGYVQAPNNQILIDENSELNQRITNLNQELKQLDAEKNQSNAQYQLYVQQLNDQLESMSKKHESLASVNEDLLNRESNLIHQMETLEKQLQSTIHLSNAAIKETHEQELTQSDENNKAIEDNNLDLVKEFQKKETELRTALVEIAQNRSMIEKLNNAIRLLQSEQPDVAKLNAANESDRIAAQKATAQNNKLKNEIENLQEAYNKMTENKLELVELLQAEKNLTKTLTLTLADNEEKLKKTQSYLVAKDEEMIRLQAESSILEKEALKHAQIMDRLNHYEVQNQSSDILQKEFELARTRLKSMAEENDRLKTILSDNNVLPNYDKSHEESLCVEEETKMSSKEIDPVETAKLYNGEDEPNKRILHSETCLHIPTNEAMKKLQERFTKLMDDVANLSDDKQRLEHLVLQLQGETETICEYIALYQKQRSILKQREYEKDIQLRLLTQERQQMKEQLDQLNELVQQLMIEYNNGSKNKMPLLQHAINGAQLQNADTADKIIKLLTDIKTNHLSEANNACDNLDNFHPCPWCSGKLIHV